MGGETMPQKSTYFYPKMATGLVLNLLKNGRFAQQKIYGRMKILGTLATFLL